MYENTPPRIPDFFFDRFINISSQKSMDIPNEHF